MAEPFLGEIRLFPFGLIPRGWAPCEGQILQIVTNQALFSILGTTYGGNGTTTFALPDLRGRVPVHVGPNASYGQSAGEAAHTLTVSELPAHSHQVQASSNPADAVSPQGTAWASTASPYAAVSPNAKMNLSAISAAGGGQPHSNMQPYLAMNFCIALEGIYPSRS